MMKKTDDADYRVGDSVVVNPGVLCPDKPDLSLAGWRGWVKEVYSEEKTVFINWDSETLRALPDDYIRECELEGLGWEGMVLGLDDTSPSEPRDTPQETKATYEDIASHHAWDCLADENPGIAELLNPLGNVNESVILQAWEDHLNDALTFPFEAKRVEDFDRGPVGVGDKIKILGIEDIDDMCGLLAKALKGKREYAIPLCDCEAIDRSSSNFQPLKDYVVWFANR